MANFIGLVYATLKNEGVDTSGMSTDEAVAKFKELQKKSGGDTGKEGTPAEQRKLEEKGVVDKKVDSYELSDSDTSVIDDAIHWVKKGGLDLTVDNVIKQINEDMSGFMPNQNDPKGKEKYNSIVNYIKEQGEGNLSIKPESLRENRNKIKSLMKNVGNKYNDEIEDLIEKDYRLLENVKATINLYPDIYQKAGIKGILRYMDINGKL